MDQGLPFFPHFDIQSDSNSLGPRWKTWHRRFENLATALNITQSARKRALLLHYAGEEVSDIFDTLPNTGTDYQTAVKVLSEYFIPRQNTEYEIYYFRMVKQRDNETLDQFYTRLRKAAATCDFSNIDKEIKSQIITGCISSKLRKHALQNPTLTLLDLITFGRANELSELHNSEIEKVMNRITNINAIRQGAALAVQGQRSHGYKQRFTQVKHRDKTCLYCGKNWHNNGLRDCPAQGKHCTTCGKKNHLAIVCMSKQSTANNKRDERNKKSINAVERREDTLILMNQRHVSGDKGQEKVTLKVLGKPISFLIDTGATVDIMNKYDYDQLQTKLSLKPAVSNTYAFGSDTPINILGTMKVTLQFQTRTHDTTIHVTSDQGPTLIGKDTALALQLIKFLHTVDNKQTPLLERYDKMFQGIGKHNRTTITLHIDKNVKPILQKHRRIPFHLHQKVEEELKDLINKDIIECVPESEPTTWISPIVVIPKKNNKQEIRICIDMRAANTAILRERHPTPTLDDIIYELNQAKVFSKLDLRKGYHQFELDAKSREITFSTHIGLFRYKRLNFGISSAAEIFQNEIRKTLQGIKGVLNVSDDILIYGKSQTEHDKALQDTLNRLQEFGLTLNKEKCIFNKHCLKFFGHVFSAEGIAVDQKKIEAISQMNTPKTQTEVRSLLGMVNFCSRFIPRLAMITQPLRELTRKNARWMWTPRHQKAMTEIQDQLACVTNIAYFECNKHTEIWTDASPSGLGAILLQKDANGNARILAFASKALTDTESKYSQIERESLAITWAVQHFRIYIFGTQFKVITDHKPLVSLFNTTNSQLSTRLERWRLKLLPYDFQVQYEPGKHNPADYLSRYTNNEKENCSALEICAETYVNFVIDNSRITAITLEEVEQHTLQDPTLQYVISHMHQDTWTSEKGNNVNEDQLKSLKKLQHELSTNKQGSILLRGACLILPATLQQKAIDIAHQGHMGIVRTKAFIREKVWFNGLDHMIEAKLKHCIPCQAATDSNIKAPLIPTSLPKGPWQEVNIDHKGPLPTGEYILIIIDQYSRFPITEIVTSTSANVNIPKIEHIFATFGIPHTVCTDNGAPFNSQEFKELVTELGFKHRKITPCYPQANGQVERFNRTISKILKIVDFSKPTWKKQLDHQLRIYRATPHSTTGSTPAELLFGYKMQTQLPEICSYGKHIDDESVRKRNQLKKENMKEYHDSHHKQRKEEIKIGDQVLIKQKQINKYSTPYTPTPYIVKDIKGNMITIENEKHKLVRNESHVKVIPPGETQTESEEELTSQESELNPQPHQLRTERKPPTRLIQEMD